MLGLWLSSAVWLWYLSQKAQWRRVNVLPWYPGKAHPSFADAAMRWQLWPALLNPGPIGV
jgi:hypothetical protein